MDTSTDIFLFLKITAEKRSVLHNQTTVLVQWYR